MEILVLPISLKKLTSGAINMHMPGNDSSIHINSRGTREHVFDAIVIGSGISGGWAAKELCEKGLRTLVLERGRNVTHNKDYPTTLKHPWEFPHRGLVAFGGRKRESYYQQVLCV
jgi:hypothetical protein